MDLTWHAHMLNVINDHTNHSSCLLRGSAMYACDVVFIEGRLRLCETCSVRSDSSLCLIVLNRNCVCLCVCVYLLETCSVKSDSLLCHNVLS
jgi:hypothetical protein